MGGDTSFKSRQKPLEKTLKVGSIHVKSHTHTATHALKLQTPVMRLLTSPQDGAETLNMYV